MKFSFGMAPWQQFQFQFYRVTYTNLTVVDLEIKNGVGDGILPNRHGMA